jgi:hypothetical protein
MKGAPNTLRQTTFLACIALSALMGCPAQKAALIGENGQILVATGFWEFNLVEDVSGNTEVYVFKLNADHSVEYDGAPYPAAWNQINGEFLLAESVDIPNGYIYEADVNDSYALDGYCYVRFNGDEFLAGFFTARYLPAHTEHDGPVEQAPLGMRQGEVS